MKIRRRTEKDWGGGGLRRRKRRIRNPEKVLYIRGLRRRSMRTEEEEKDREGIVHYRRTQEEN